MLKAPANFFIFGGIFVFALMLVPSELIASKDSIPKQFDIDAATKKHPNLLQINSHLADAEAAHVNRVLRNIFFRSGGASRLFQIIYNITDIFRKSKAKKLTELYKRLASLNDYQLNGVLSKINVGLLFMVVGDLSHDIMKMFFSAPNEDSTRTMCMVEGTVSGKVDVVSLKQQLREAFPDADQIAVEATEISNAKQHLSARKRSNISPSVDTFQVKVKIVLKMLYLAKASNPVLNLKKMLEPTFLEFKFERYKSPHLPQSALKGDNHRRPAQISNGPPQHRILLRPQRV